jgi:NAD(P)-dependent dehydrogenase (short-subunit alcohol dehydrogenase family)
MKTLYVTGVPGALATVMRDTFLQSEWSVIGFGRHADHAADERYHYVEMDATDETSVISAFASAGKIAKPTAVICTVGGVRKWKPVRGTDLDDFRALLDLNLVSFFLTAREALRSLQEGGTIISIGAESALNPSANKGAYVASKAGVMALTKAIAKEGKASGITANCIVPTIIRTQANEEWGTPEDVPKWTSPEDIARMCLLLCSEHGRSVTGSLIEMPGRL